MPRINADLSEVKKEDMEHERGWLCLEDGEYRFMITQTDYRENAAGNGNNLILTMQCLDPQHPRSKWKEFLSIEHENPEAVRIARATLKKIAIAVGLSDPNFVECSEDLENIPFIGKTMKERSREAKYGDRNGMQNRMADYKPIGAAQGTRKRAAPAASTRTHDEPPPHTDDDISF